MRLKFVIILMAGVLSIVAPAPGGGCRNGGATSKNKTYETTLLPGELWWGGLSRDGSKMPYTSQTSLTRDLWANNYENQSQPLLISKRSRYVWCEEPIKLVTFPPGTWLGDDSSRVEGPRVQTIDMPLDRLPYFTRQ